MKDENERRMRNDGKKDEVGGNDDEEKQSLDGKRSFWAKAENRPAYHSKGFALN